MKELKNIDTKVENYRELKKLKTSLEYRLCLTIDPEERKKIKKKCFEIKATLKIIECAVETLKDEPEYQVVYYAYIKEGWARKSIPRIAQELYISEDWAYAKRKSGKDKVNAFLKYVYYSLVS